MSDFLGMPDPGRRRDPRRAVPRQQERPKRPDAAAAASPRTTRTCCSILADARRHRPDQRPPLRAQPRADHGRGARPDRPRTARRGLPEAVLAAPHRPGGRRPGRPRPGPRQGRARGRSPRLAAEAADELRAVVVELRPAALDEDGLRRHPAHPGRGPRPGPLRAGHLPRPPASGPCPPPRRRRCCGSPRRPCTTPCATPAPAAVERHPRTGRGKRRRACASATTAAASTPAAVRRAGRHLGLVSMRDRAGGVGGTTHRANRRPARAPSIEMEVPGG